MEEAFEKIIARALHLARYAVLDSAIQRFPACRFFHRLRNTLLEIMVGLAVEARHGKQRTAKAQRLDPERGLAQRNAVVRHCQQAVGIVILHYDAGRKMLLE